mgnify:CR=1 FL=1
MFFRVSGRSMEPKFKEGSLLFVDRLVYRLSGLKVGDVVVVKDPRDKERLILKRVTRVEGEKIFILGDNLESSTDSRKFGAVERKLIVGKVMLRLSKNISVWLIGGILFFSLIGALDSLYLTIQHYTVGYTNCGVEASDCAIVTGSSYSVMFGVPTALYGVFYYLVAFVLGVVYLKIKKTELIKYLGGWSVIGFSSSLYLLYIQAFVLRAFCKFCLVSSATSTIILVLALIMVKRVWKGRKLS